MDSPDKDNQSPQTVTYDLHGIVAIRLVDASPSDIVAVDRQLGPIRRPINREPDIVIRFIDRFSTNSRIRYLGLDGAGFTDDAFLVLYNKHSRVKVQIPFDQIGHRCVIICETGLPAVPLLIPIINLTALANGAMPLHASAFAYNGIGVLATGWSKGGKTETLLAFMSNGGRYIGDEWVYIGSNGQRMYGIPEPIRVWDWHLEELPHIRTLIKPGDRARLKAIKVIRGIDRVVDRALFGMLDNTQMAKKIRSLLKRQLYVDMPPSKLFCQELNDLSFDLDKVLFVVSHESGDVTIQPEDPNTIAMQMVFSLQYERLSFMSYYLAFKLLHCSPTRRRM
jgi:hypothetical protein